MACALVDLKGNTTLTFTEKVMLFEGTCSIFRDWNGIGMAEFMVSWSNFCSVKYET